MTEPTRVANASALQSAIQLNVALLVVLAAVSLVAPVSLLRGFGIVDAPFAVLGIVRVFAVLAVALGAFIWSARGWLTSPSGVGGVRALALAYGLGSVILVIQQWSVWYGRSGVALMLGCAVLAASYGFLPRTHGENREAVA